MIVQILRTVLFGAAVYLFSKVARQLIDRQLEKPKNKPDFDHSNIENSKPDRLIPCQKCGSYFDPAHPHIRD